MVSAVLFSAVDAVAAGAAGSAAALGASASAGAQKLRAMAPATSAAVRRWMSLCRFMLLSSFVAGRKWGVFLLLYHTRE